jgi:hypothetical protein
MNEETESLESYCPGGRAHALIRDPATEGIDEG